MPNAAQTEGKYNFIYSKLVADENDILGIIAYAIYKRQKIDFIKTTKETYDRDPTPEEFQTFYNISTTSSSLETYKAQAVELSQVFLDVAL